jgi:hypothetical protein
MDAPFVVAESPELFPREPYELEIMYHLAGLADLLHVSGYPSSSRGVGSSREKTGATREALEAWVNKWVVAPVRERLEDVVRFSRDDAEQAWLHSWIHTRNGSTILYRNWGAVGLGLLLGVEQPVVDFAMRLFANFFRQSNTGSMDGMLRMTLDGFHFCPRLHSGSKAKSAKTAQKDLPSIFRVNERLHYSPQIKRYGTLEPGRAAPTTHLDFVANLSPLPQVHEDGDIVFTYSRDSHTLTARQKVERLVAGMNDGTRGTTQDRGIVRSNHITEDAILRAMQFDTLSLSHMSHGFDLAPDLGVSIEQRGKKRSYDATTSPLWVGPAQTLTPWNPGCLLCFPANLVHGYRNYNLHAKKLHLAKRINYSPSYQVLSHGTNPSGYVWNYSWGIVDQKHTTTTTATGTGTTTAATGTTTGPLAAGREYPVAFLRSTADLTHGKSETKRNSSMGAMAYALKTVPETTAFISLPVQLARALTLRFPELYMDKDTLTLARALVHYKQAWRGQHEVEGHEVEGHEAVRMLQHLWVMFE